MFETQYHNLYLMSVTLSELGITLGKSTPQLVWLLKGLFRKALVHFRVHALTYPHCILATAVLWHHFFEIASDTEAILRALFVGSSNVSV